MPEAEPTTVTVVTANLYRLLNVPPIWLVRRGHAVKVLDSTAADIICVQECTETQEKYLLQHMTGPWGSASDWVNVGVMFRADKYRKLDARPFTLKNKSSRNRNRYASGAILEDLTDGSKVCVVSPHLASSGDGLAPESRPYQAEQLLDQMERWAASSPVPLPRSVFDMPCILGGDWNDGSNTKGIVPVLQARGFRDARSVLDPSSRSIDRFFVNDQLTPTKIETIKTGIASDHDWKRAVFALGPLTPLQKLELEHGPVTEFKVSSFEAARVSGKPSRYTAIVQDWLGREVTCWWSTADQQALDQWRHLMFPSWPVRDYTGSVGPTSMSRLATVAKAAGKTVYRVVP